jgi:3,4-dihydroxy 2-butanone 4-phosphate synthase/GTP cyclohydrolase II
MQGRGRLLLVPNWTRSPRHRVWLRWQQRLDTGAQGETVGPDRSHTAGAAPIPLLQAEALHVTRGNETFKVYIAEHDSGEHVVLVRGDVSGQEGVLCRVSSACVMSTALGSAECDCKDQLAAAMDLIAKEGRGILIYLVNQEGRGHGLKWKIRALKHKNEGMDTFAAVEELGLPPDIRQYDVVPQILDELQVASVTLLTNNPEKVHRIQGAGVTVKETQQLEVCPPAHAWRHMEAKRDRGHRLAVPYIDDDTAEIAVLGRWLPPVIAQAGDSSHDGAASTLSH